MNLAFAAQTTRAVILILLICFVASGKANAKEPVFGDEFNGTSGQPPDASKWTAATGGSGWGNQELQFYRNSPENAFMDGNGSLVIKAVKMPALLDLTCWYGPCGYTSARLSTKGKFDLKYGRFEARIKIPEGQGIWPAFWMLGSDIDSVGWPACGEIDIMENIGRESSLVHGTVHGPGYSGDKGIGSSTALKDRAPFARDFHVYAIEWTAGEIRWFVDGTKYKSLKPKDLPPGSKWVFDHPHFIILNLAIGGAWPGNPDAATNFPQTMQIDYVRVYK
jgi:beta-glucanase (GH16 family)